MAPTTRGGASGATAKQTCPCPCPCPEEQAGVQTDVQADGLRVVSDAATVGPFAGPPFQLRAYDDGAMLTLGDRGSVVLSGPELSFRGRDGGFAVTATGAATAIAGPSGTQVKPTETGKERSTGALGQVVLPKYTEEQRRRMDVEAKMRPAPSVKQADPTASSFESAQAQVRGQFGGASPVDQRRSAASELARKMQKELAEAGVRLDENGPSAGGKEPSPDRLGVQQLTSPSDPTAKDFKTTAKFNEGVGQGRGSRLEEVKRARDEARKQPPGAPAASGAPAGASPPSPQSGAAGLSAWSGEPSAGAAAGSAHSVVSATSSISVAPSKPSIAPTSGPAGAVAPDRRAAAPTSESVGEIDNTATPPGGGASPPPADGLSVGITASPVFGAASPRSVPGHAHAAPDAPKAPPTAEITTTAEITAPPSEQTIDLTAVGATTIQGTSAPRAAAQETFVDLADHGVTVIETPRSVHDAATDARHAPVASGGRSVGLGLGVTPEPQPGSGAGAGAASDAGASTGRDTTLLGPTAFRMDQLEGGVAGAGGRTSQPSNFWSAASDLRWSARFDRRFKEGDHDIDDKTSAEVLEQRAIEGVAREWNATLTAILASSNRSADDASPGEKKQIARARQSAKTDLARAIRQSQLVAWKAGGKKGPKPSKEDALELAERTLSAAEKVVAGEREASREGPQDPAPPPVAPRAPQGGGPPRGVARTESAAGSGLPIPHGIDASELDCECPCPCEGDGDGGSEGGRDGGGGVVTGDGGDDEDDEGGVQGSGETTEDPFDVDPIVRSDAEGPRTKSERLKLLEIQRRLEREKKTFIRDSIRALRKLFREKGVRKVPSFSAWLRDAHIRELLSAKFDAQLARRIAVGQIERVQQYIADGVPGFSQRDLEFYNLRVGGSFLSEALLDFEIKSAAGFATALDAIELVEAAQQLDAWTVDFHAGSDGAEAAPGLGAVWMQALSRNGSLVEMLADAEPTMQQAVVDAASAVSWWDAPSILSSGGASLVGGAILEYVSDLRDAPKVREDAGLDERQLRDRLVGAMGAIGAAQRQRMVEGAEALVAKQFEGMEPWEIGVYTAGALLIGVASGGLAAGGYAIAGGSALKVIAVSAAVGALGAAAEESLWQSLKHDSLSPSKWDDGAVGTAALFGGVAGGVLGPFAAKGAGITATTFRGGVREYVDRGVSRLLGAGRYASVQGGDEVAGMAARGARGSGRGLDLAKLREIHLKRVGYEDVSELRVPGRHVEWRNPGKLPEGFVARTSFEDGKTILSKELLQDRELAVKILREEAMHARRIAQIPEGQRGFYAFLYRRSFVYHMREEAIAHAYAVRLQSGAGYGFTHAWQQVGVANLEMGGAGLLGLGTYFALRPDDQ